MNGATIIVNTANAVFFPLDEVLALPERHWSTGVVRRVVWLSGKFSYGDALAVLEEGGEFGISKSTVWQLTQRQTRCRH